MNVGKALVTAMLITGGGFVAGATEQTRPVVMRVVTPPLPKKIEMQGRTIHIRAREGKPTRFTVKSKDGSVLARKATLDELQRKNPALAHFVRNALATQRSAVRHARTNP